MEITVGELYQLLGERDAEIFALKREIARHLETCTREAPSAPTVSPALHVVPADDGGA